MNLTTEEKQFLLDCMNFLFRPQRDGREEWLYGNADIKDLWGDKTVRLVESIKKKVAE